MLFLHTVLRKTEEKHAQHTVFINGPEENKGKLLKNDGLGNRQKPRIRHIRLSYSKPYTEHKWKALASRKDFGCAFHYKNSTFINPSIYLLSVLRTTEETY